MTDDLGKRLRDLDNEMSAYLVGPDRFLFWRATIREAATRLSPPAGDKVEAVEAVARAIYERGGQNWIDERYCDEVGPSFYSWNEVVVAYPSVAEAARKSARAALAVRPSGAEMRERAAKVADRHGSGWHKQATEGTGKIAVLAEGMKAAADMIAKDIRALPLSPEEEGRT